MFALGSKENLKKSSKKCCVLASHSLLQINNGWLGDSWIDWSCVHCSEFWKAKPLVLVPSLNLIFTIGWWSSMIQRPRVQLQCIGWSAASWCPPTSSNAQSATNLRSSHFPYSAKILYIWIPLAIVHYSFHNLLKFVSFLIAMKKSFKFGHKTKLSYFSLPN